MGSGWVMMWALPGKRFEVKKAIKSGAFCHFFFTKRIGRNRAATLFLGQKLGKIVERRPFRRNISSLYTVFVASFWLSSRTTFDPGWFRFFCPALKNKIFHETLCMSSLHLISRVSRNSKPRNKTDILRHFPAVQSREFILFLHQGIKPKLERRESDFMVPWARTHFWRCCHFLLMSLESPGSDMEWSGDTHSRD